jgi:glucose repression regulatory protein TUP1
MSPDGRYVAAGSLDKCVRIWDTQTGSMVERTEGDSGHADSVYSVAFSPRGDVLVSGSLDKTIRMWRFQHRGYPPQDGRPPTLMRGDCIRIFEGHKDFVLSVALSPDGKWVMSGSKDRGVQFWDPETGDAQLMLQGHKNSGKSSRTLPAWVTRRLFSVLLLTRQLLLSHLRRAVTQGRTLRHRIR